MKSSDVFDQSLPRGRHDLTREDVERSQRGRLCFAVLDVVAERGYASTTIADIVMRANVSRRIFYELLTSKEDSFVTAFELAVDIVETRLRQAIHSAGPVGWRALLSMSIETYLEILADEPNATQALHVETLNAGPTLVAERNNMLRVFAERMRGVHNLARLEDSSLPELPIEVFDFLVEGIDSRIRFHLSTRSARELPDLAPLLTNCAMALFGIPTY